MILDDTNLWLRCAEWGSYMNNSDPGACMYGFNGVGSFQSPDHARAVVSYVEGSCLSIPSEEEVSDRQDLQDILDTANAYLDQAHAKYQEL